MKKFLLMMSTLGFLLVSCEVKKTDSTDSDAREKNLNAITEINKAMESGDVSKLDAYISPDAVDHASPEGDIKGVDSIKSMLGKIHTMGANMKIENIRTVADGEYVFQWMRVTGTTASSDMGMPAGKDFDINAVQVSRFANGKLAEHWEFLQPAETAKMLDTEAMEAATAPNSTIDTVRKN